MAVAAPAQFDALFCHQQGALTTVRFVAGGAVETITVGEVGSLQAGLSASGVVTLRTHCRRRSFEQGGAISHVGVVTLHAVTSAGGQVGERRCLCSGHLVEMAITAELVHGLYRTEGLPRARIGMTPTTGPGRERSMDRFPEQSSSRGGMRIVTLLTVGSFDGVVAVGGPKRIVRRVAGGTDP